MALYPSLEDMKVHQIQQQQINIAEQQLAHSQQAYPSSGYNQTRRISEDYPHGYNYGGAGMSPATGAYPTTPSAIDSSSLESAYPSLMDEYMGLKLEPPTGPYSTPPPTQGPPPGYGSHGDQVAAYRPAGTVVAPLPANSSSGAGGQLSMVAPLSGNNVGLRRANVTHGVREVILCKDAKGKCGLRLRAISKGIFIQFVTANSPAALAGLRFGDQILQVDGQNVAGFSDDKAMAVIRKANPQRIVMAVRDRPFERTMTLHKDSTGHIGFQFKNGKINAISKDSSAARNGLLTDHQLLEVGGQNVVGLKDNDVTKMMLDAGQIVTITIMPSQIFDHMIKNMASGLVKKLMDHSIPEI